MHIITLIVRSGRMEEEVTHLSLILSGVIRGTQREVDIESMWTIESAQISDPYVIRRPLFCLFAI